MDGLKNINLKWPLSSINFEVHRFAVGETHLAVANSNIIYVYDTSTGKKIATQEQACSKDITSMCVSGCGRFLYTGSGDKNVKKWDLSEGFMLHGTSEQLPGWVTKLNTSAGGGDGQMQSQRAGSGAVLAICQEYAVVINDDQLLKEATKKKPHANGVDFIAMSCDGKKIVTTAKSKDHKKQAFKLWNRDLSEVSGGGKIKNPHSAAVRGIVFSPSDADTFYSYSNDCSVKIWQFSQKQPTTSIEGKHTAAINDLSFSWDTSTFLTCDDSEHMLLWDTSTMEPTASSSAGTIIDKAAFSTDNCMVALSRGGDVLIFEQSDDAPNNAMDNSKILQMVEKPAKRASISEPNTSRSSLTLPGASLMVPNSTPPKPPSQARSGLKGGKSPTGKGATGPRRNAKKKESKPPPGKPPASPKQSGGLMKMLSFRSRSSTAGSEASIQSATSTTASSTTVVGGPPSGPNPNAQAMKDMKAKCDAAIKERDELLKENEKLKREVLVKDANIAKTEISMKNSSEQYEQRLLDLDLKWKMYSKDFAEKFKSESDRFQEIIKQHEADNRTLLVTLDEKTHEFENLLTRKTHVISAKEEQVRSMETDITLLKDDLKETQKDREKYGHMTQIVFDILKGTKCMDVHHSPSDDEENTRELSNMIQDAISASGIVAEVGTSASSLQDAVQRHKKWEKDKRAELAQNIRSLVLEAEIEFSYQRRDSIERIEKLRNRTEGNLKEIYNKLRGDEQHCAAAKKKVTEMAEELREVDQKVVKLHAELEYEEGRRNQLKTTGQNTDVFLIHTAIQELNIEIQKWDQVKRDFGYDLSKLEAAYAKAFDAKLKSKVLFDKRKNGYDSGMGKAFIFGIKIVSDADEKEAAEEFRLRQMEDIEDFDQTRREEVATKRAAASARRRQIEQDEEMREKIQKDRDSYHAPYHGSPAALYGTSSTWSRIKDKIDGKYDFDFKDFISRDSKLQKGDTPFKTGSVLQDMVSSQKPLNRALFADSATEASDRERASIQRRVKKRMNS
mmetsp:Transcript_23794/g.44718  ORF Transcript_23794/g.44718 Transcript_23794/m.44718 type:complete len:1014 (+) Transcript_23794:231-3272(+)|eukprot:CAMPEP_0182502496 /NCGR_PEP_ID=MMETSP1321-20130603/13499_1 /TAXON_ID=91990 /ORGANISM="Bolidomonas sp., Strain RCC1657" /LENGTH=1013 /DNA_ID=CAMNT_0024707433 /DNA_START=220 /DNA_END=3261 /DNA_ORIENTATION=-